MARPDRKRDVVEVAAALRPLSIPQPVSHRADGRPSGWWPTSRGKRQRGYRQSGRAS